MFLRMAPEPSTAGTLVSEDGTVPPGDGTQKWLEPLYFKGSRDSLTKL
ncbi:hypothetical protein ALQ08_200078 [Pseudomonas syringae pv. delphinii]|uniref:Uncharacterized protein n=1 Tax=Pseudomonas syringae pv. delphinii TaxID=192088 RepID=A0A3M4JVJ3_9PSED|nr:hypothetical protein ALQ08_200078 [Pseudomonas syringae pv. delphinii]